MPSVPDLVSIVLPTFNGSRYIREAVASCLKQTYSPIEVVIVDDGSTDKTQDILESVAARDARVRCVRHKENRGISAALNTGFSHCTGAYWTWTSDDNCFRPNAIAEMVRYLRENLEAGMVYADFTFIDDSGREVRTHQVQPRERLLHGNTIGPCFLYRREVAEVVGEYSEEMRLAEDYDYWLRVSARFLMEPLHVNLYSYRRHAGSLTASESRQAGRVADRALEKHLSSLAWADDEARGHAFLRLARRAAKRREWPRVLRCLWLARRYGVWFPLGPAIRRRLDRLWPRQGRQSA